MVHPAFDISINDVEVLPDEGRLLIEISVQAFNYIIFTRDPLQLYLLRQYRIYTSADKTGRDVLEEIISGDEVLQKYARAATVVYNFPESSIVPSEIFSQQIKNPITSLVHGNADHHFVFNEQVPGSEMQNIYSVPKDLHSLCRDKFRDSQYWHIYSMILAWSESIEKPTDNFARVIFYNDKFIAAIYKQSQLHLIQTFAYQTPEDVAYYLLLVCKQFGIGQYEIRLIISGLIDEQSALYTELLKYFAQVEHEGIPGTYGTNGLLDEYPAHYFSPLLKMSLCVS